MRTLIVSFACALLIPSFAAAQRIAYLTARLYLAGETPAAPYVVRTGIEEVPQIGFDDSPPSPHPLVARLRAAGFRMEYREVPLDEPSERACPKFMSLYRVNEFRDAHGFFNTARGSVIVWWLWRE